MIDLSYKDYTLRYHYDIESTPDLFTIAFITEKSFSLILLGNSQFNTLNSGDLLKQMRKFANRKESKRILKYSDIDDMKYNVYKIDPQSDKSLGTFINLMDCLVRCVPLPCDIDLAKQIKNNYLEKNKLADDSNGLFAEYCGWNSDNYDKILIALIVSYFSQKSYRSLSYDERENLPRTLRDLSNLIINFNDKPWRFVKYLSEKGGNLVAASSYQRISNLMHYWDGHIDWAKIAKLGAGEGVSEGDGNVENQIPPSLKKTMARLGLDIIIDESVASDEFKVWSEEEKNTLIEYNFNDVLGTYELGRLLNSSLQVRDSLAKDYTFISARSGNINSQYKSGGERDMSAATLASLIINGPKKLKPVDWETVQYTFPVPNGNGGFKTVDLLDYMKEKEKFMHPLLYTFFDHFRGKDTRSAYDDKQVKYSQPITHSAFINIPYYCNGKPTDSYIRASTGGAHGSVMASLSQMTDSEIEIWIRNDIGATNEQKFTVDKSNVIHIDWTSYYPTMADKMRLYELPDGSDYYAEQIPRRKKLKAMLPYDKSEWTEEHYKIDLQQDGAKFVLNNATGAGNMHNPYGLLPLDNKTLSMRLIGNMNIWCLGQRLAEAGAFIISTNTDGLYVCNITLELAEEIVNGYIADYGLGVEPEPMDRFINRDVSTRIEYSGKNRNKVGGRLRHGNGLEISKRSMTENIPYALVAANAAMEYMNDPDWLTKPYDPTIIRDYIQNLVDTNAPISAFYHVFIGTKARKLTVNDKIHQHISRVILTTDGDKLGNLKNTTLTKTEILDFIQFLAQLDKPTTFNEWANKCGYKLSTNIGNLAIDINKIGFCDKDKTTDTYCAPFIQLTDIVNNEAKSFELAKNQFEQFLKENEQYKGKSIKQLSKICPGIYEAYKKAEDSLTTLYNTISKGRYLCVMTTGESTGDAKFIPIKVWKAGAITGYPSHRGKTLDLAIDLTNFDYSKIDVEAYAVWAETILQNWKVTADVPALGMTATDDTIIKSANNIKNDQNMLKYNVLDSLYRNLINFAR